MYWNNLFKCFSVLSVVVVFRWNFGKLNCVVLFKFFIISRLPLFSLFLSIYIINKMIHTIHIHTGFPVEIYSHCECISFMRMRITAAEHKISVLNS